MYYSWHEIFDIEPLSESWNSHPNTQLFHALLSKFISALTTCYLKPYSVLIDISVSESGCTFFSPKKVTVTKEATFARIMQALKTRAKNICANGSQSSL